MYVCMYVRVYVCMYVCMYVCVYVWRMLFCLENVTYLLNVTPSNPLLHSLFPIPISLHVIQVQNYVAKQHSKEL